MGVVTGDTFPLCNRCMLRHGLLLTPDGVLMASATDSKHIIFEKAFFLGCMRVVAAQAPLFRQNRPVYPVLCKHLVDHGTVTAAAKFVAALSGLERGR